jgi:hypothetical protein
MKRFVTVVGVLGGIAFGLTVAGYRELRKPMPFPRAREAMNRSINPLLLRLGFIGGHNSHLGTIEHVGRVSGIRRLSPIYPHLEGDTVLIPVPLREQSQWAQNVLAAGQCRLQVRETLYDLDQPVLIPAREVAHLSPMIRSILGRFGWEYLVLHRVADVPGTFAVHGGTVPVATGATEPTIEGAFELPAFELPA